MAVLSIFEVLYVCQKVCFRTPVAPVVVRKGVESLPGNFLGESNVWFVVVHMQTFGSVPQPLEALKRDVQLV